MINRELFQKPRYLLVDNKFYLLIILDNTKEYFCPFCGQIIKKGNGWHIRKCIKNYVDNITEEEKEKIKNLYIVEKRSLVELSEILKLPYSNLQKILPILGIELRNIKEACNTSRRKEKYEKTMMEHFGTKHNFDKNCSSRKKWEKRLFEEEGITNVFQRKDVIEKIHNTMVERYGENEWKLQRSKSSDINYYIEKYGKEKGIIEWNRVCFEKGKSGKKEYYIEKYGEEKGIEKWNERLKKIAKGFTHNNGLNEKCSKILTENKICFEKEYPLASEKHNYFYDFKIGNVLIELNGLYWHCSPKIYKPNDLVKFPNNKFILAKDKWKYDEEKCKFAEKRGYKIITIWEDEFNEEKLLTLLKENNYGNC